MSCSEEKVEEDDEGDDQEIEIYMCSRYMSKIVGQEMQDINCYNVFLFLFDKKIDNLNI